MLKYSTKEDADKLEGEKTYFLRSIEDLKAIQEGGTEGIKIALKMFKSYRDTVSLSRSNCFVNVTQEKLLQATEFAGEERALNYVIQLFENPKSNIEFYQTELDKISKQLRERKKYPQRD